MGRSYEVLQLQEEILLLKKELEETRKEKRVYLIDAGSEFDFYNSTKEEIITQAEKEGTIYSLEGFANAWNAEEISYESFILVN